MWYTILYTVFESLVVFFGSLVNQAFHFETTRLHPPTGKTTPQSSTTLWFLLMAIIPMVYTTVRMPIVSYCIVYEMPPSCYWTALPASNCSFFMAGSFFGSPMVTLLTKAEWQAVGQCKDDDQSTKESGGAQPNLWKLNVCRQGHVCWSRLVPKPWENAGKGKHTRLPKQKPNVWSWMVRKQMSPTASSPSQVQIKKTGPMGLKLDACHSFMELS
jgi:hypothetical protein